MCLNKWRGPSFRGESEFRVRFGGNEVREDLLQQTPRDTELQLRQVGAGDVERRPTTGSRELKL